MLFSLIDKNNYEIMLENITNFIDDDKVVGNSNFGKLMNYLTNEDDSWIETINKYLGL